MGVLKPPSMPKKFELQIIGDPKKDGNYRITHSASDNRIATSYDHDHAELVVNALNFYSKYRNAIEKGVIVAGVIIEDELQNSVEEIKN